MSSISIPKADKATRIALQKLSKRLKYTESPTFVGLTLTGLTTNSLIYPNGSSLLTSLGAATNGQIPIGNTGNPPTLAGITGTTNQITVTNGAGTITLSTPQDLDTACDFVCGSLIVDTKTLYVDSVTRMVGIGHTDAESDLHVASEASDATRDVIIENNNSNDAAALVILRKSNGTHDTPTAITTGFEISNIIPRGYDGTSYLDCAYDICKVTGVVSTGSISSQRLFYTRNTTSAPALALTLDENQNAQFTGDVTVNDLTVNSPSNVYALSHDSFADFTADEHFLQTAITNVSTALSTGLLKVTTGTGALSVITDSSTNWDAAYTHVTSDGSDHAFIDQDVTNGSSPTFTTVTGNLSGTATNATNVTLTNDELTAASHYLTFASGTGGNYGLKTASNRLTFNPSTFLLSSYALAITGTGAYGISGDTAIELTGTGVGGNLFKAQGATTDFKKLEWTNTGGTLLLGIERSAGTGLTGGSSAYASVLGTTGATPLEFTTNNTVRASISSSGAVNVVGLTASRLVITDASKNLSSIGSDVTSAELETLTDGSTTTLHTHTGLVPDIGARVYRTTSQSVNSATDTAVSFDSEDYDTDSIHEGVTNPTRLTCKTAGKYRISGGFIFNTFAAASYPRYAWASLRVNGTTLIIADIGFEVTSGTYYPRLCVSTEYELAVNDYVELYAFQDSGAAVNILARNTGINRPAPHLEMRKLA